MEAMLLLILVREWAGQLFLSTHPGAELPGMLIMERVCSIMMTII